MKEQDKAPREQLSKVEIGHISEEEFTVVVVKVI